ncbi:MAG: hypothetical protein HY882_04435 [Deltaproteobacteria bacterium]|nr:hypothetical protein [Deltaproteobacteria bacterium]
MQRVSVFILLAVLSSSAGCGYHFADSRSGLPSGGRSIAISGFANQTMQTGIESELTRALVEKFISAGRLIVTKQISAEALLTGSVRSFVISPVTVTSGTQVATEYRATLTIEATLQRQRDGKVLWKGEVSEWRNYRVVSDLTTTEANKREAIRQISERLAERLHVMVWEDF